MGRMTSATHCGSFLAVLAPAPAWAQAAGYSISTRLATVASTAAWFMLTIFSLFLANIFLISSLRAAMASSTGITLASLKKAVCMIMLMRPPRPTSWAIFTASML